MQLDSDMRRLVQIDSVGGSAVLTAGHVCKTPWYAGDPPERSPRRINVTVGAYKLQNGGTLTALSGLDVEGSHAVIRHEVEFFYPSRPSRGGSNMHEPLRDADVCMLVLKTRVEIRPVPLAQMGEATTIDALLHAAQMSCI